MIFHNPAGLPPVDLILIMLSFLVSQISAHQPRLMKRQTSSMSSTTTSLPAQLRTIFPLPVSTTTYQVQTNIPVSTSTSSSSSSSDKKTAIIVTVVIVVLVVLLIVVIGALFWRWKKRKQVRLAAARNVVQLDKRDSSISTNKVHLADNPESPVHR